MTEKLKAGGPDKAVFGRQWSGRFNHTDTKGLLQLNPSFFCLDRIMEKRWCYVGIIHPDIIFGCAVIHLGYIASAFVFGFDRREKRMIEHAPVFFPIGQAVFDRNPENGITSYQSLWGRLCMTHDQANTGKKNITANFFLPGRSIKANIEITEPAESFFPMHFLTPMEKGKLAFTTKAAGLTAKGKIILNQKPFDLDPETTFALFDWTNGFYPRHTSWNWACGAGFAHDGTRIGFNFSSGVYENGLPENTIWINGKPEPADEIIFAYDPQNPLLPWQVKSRDGSVNLIFKPEGIRQAHDDLFIIKSRFIQPCGTFEGFIKTGKATFIRFSDVGGVVEEHHAKW